MTRISNEVIVERLDNFKASMDKHFENLNGQVARNTKFRTQFLAVMKVGGFIFGGGGVVGLAIFLFSHI